MSTAPESLPLQALVTEAQRVLAICNACRYCEGYCAVFPALQRRLTFAEGDVHYLANLCHNCGACLYACQYAPPHEFQLNFPRLMSEARKATYKKYAWPAPLRATFERNGAVVAIVTALSLALLLVMVLALNGPVLFLASHVDAEGSFYAVLPHRIMASVFGFVFVGILLVLAVSLIRFWRDGGDKARELVQPRALAEAASDAASLRYLDGGGDGCTYPDQKPSFARRNFHHLTFYGFMLCFAATVAGTFYHYVLGRPAPYPLASLPVVLGTLGGVGLVAGPVGLLWLKRRRDPELVDVSQTGMDAAFLWLLILVSATGLGLLALRETRAMGILLVLHLGTVMGLFVTMPYGKFVHAGYRMAALVRFHLERRRPLPDLGAE